jgi:hypothetical protein
MVTGPIEADVAVPAATMSVPSSNGWVPSRLLRGLLVWTALTTVVFWLPTVRGLFDGTSYTWALAGFGGAGLTGDYWFPVVGVAFALVMLALGSRGARAPFHVLLVGWHVLLLTGVIHAARSDPEGFRFRGDSLGIDISLAWIGPIVFAIPGLLSILWAWRDLRTETRARVTPWERRNSHWLLGLLALLPLQFGLLHYGPPGSSADAIGVLITIGQWLLVGRALRPYRFVAASST